MHVYVHGQLRHRRPVSTGRGRYATPSGSFRPQRLAWRWHSSKYNRAPMPFDLVRGHAFARTRITIAR